MRGLFWWTSKHDYDKAIKDYDAAICIAPKDGELYSSRGGVWRRKREYDKAIRDYEEAIHLAPNGSIAYTSLAELLATCPEERVRDGRRAIRLATKARDLTPEVFGRSWALATLAAAYAEVGQFDEAERYQKEALEDSHLRESDRDDYRQRLELYKQKRPYRDDR